MGGGVKPDHNLNPSSLPPMKDMLVFAGKVIVVIAVARVLQTVLPIPQNVQRFLP